MLQQFPGNARAFCSRTRPCRRPSERLSSLVHPHRDRDRLTAGTFRGGQDAGAGPVKQNWKVPVQPACSSPGSPHPPRSRARMASTCPPLSGGASARGAHGGRAHWFKTTPKPRGRPRSGPAGARTRDLPRRTLGWPATAEARLEAACFVQARPVWEVLSDALSLYVSKLPPTERELVEKAAKRRVSGIRARFGTWRAAPACATGTQDPRAGRAGPSRTAASQPTASAPKACVTPMAAD